jgi:hypothetical protein
MLARTARGRPAVVACECTAPWWPGKQWAPAGLSCSERGGDVSLVRPRGAYWI